MPIPLVFFEWNVVEEEQILEVIQATTKGKAKQPFHS